MNKVLLISLGSIGRRHLNNARELLPDAQIAVYRTHFKGDGEPPPGADQVFYDRAAALAFRPDAVVISSPANAHVGQARDFIGNGAHLFVEKPLATSHAALDGIVETCENSACFSMVGYVLRFQPILGYLRGLLNDGEIGDIRTANVQVGQYLPDWRPDADYRAGVSARHELGGGALLELSHEIDYSTWLFGMPDSLLCSRGRVGDLEIDVEDSACVIMEYGRERPARRVVVQVDFLQRVASMALQVVGSKGTLYADLVEERAHIVAPQYASPYQLDVPKMAAGNEMYLRQFDFFFSRCFPGYDPRFAETGGFTGYADVAQAAAVLKLVDSAKTASDEGRRVGVDG